MIYSKPSSPFWSSAANFEPETENKELENKKNFLDLPFKKLKKCSPKFKIKYYYY